MTTQPSKFKHGEITNKIIQAFYEVYNELGIGFEKEVYINSLAILVSKKDLALKKNQKIEVEYKGEQVGYTLVDLIVEEKVLVAVFRDKRIEDYNEQIIFNQLRASKFEVGLVLNFGINPEFIRKEPANRIN